MIIIIMIITSSSSGRSVMYTRKSVGPRMEPWGTPPLPGYYCEDFSSRTTQSHTLLRKEEIRPNIWPEIPEYLSLSRRPACQTLWNPLDVSSATAGVATDLLKTLTIISDTIVRRSEIKNLQFFLILKSYMK